MERGEMIRPEPEDGRATVEALREVLEVARTAVAQEFEISERLAGKARAQVALIGQWFAIVQAVSAIAYDKSVSGWWLYTVAGLGLLGAVALVATVLLSRQVWKQIKTHEITPEGLMDMQQQAKGSADPGVLAEKIGKHLASVLQSRRAANKERSHYLDRAEVAWFFAMALPMVQLGFALATRLFA